MQNKTTDLLGEVDEEVIAHLVQTAQNYAQNRPDQAEAVLPVLAVCFTDMTLRLQAGRDVVKEQHATRYVLDIADFLQQLPDGPIANLFRSLNEGGKDPAENAATTEPSTNDETVR